MASYRNYMFAIALPRVTAAQLSSTQNFCFVLQRLLLSNFRFMEMIITRSFALILFACFLKTGNACKVGKFKTSVDGQCPHGTSAVTNKATCSAITMLDGVQIHFFKRPPPCLYMPDLPFGCYKDDGVLRFNPLDKEYMCVTKELLVRSNNPSSIPSVCQCTGDVISASSNAKPPAASTSKKANTNMEFTLSLSSRCPKGTTVLSDQTLCEQVGNLFSLQEEGPFKYAGKIGPAARDKRPPGCFIDNFEHPTVQCQHVLCAYFNEGDYSSHDSFVQTTEFLAVCITEQSTTSASTTTTTSTLFSTVIVATTALKKRSKVLSGCGSAGVLQKTPYCPPGTYNIYSHESCQQSFELLPFDKNSLGVRELSGLYIGYEFIVST